MLEGSKVVELVPFNLNEPEYTQSTFSGRFMTLLRSQNPLNFFLPHYKIVEAKQIIDEEKSISKGLKSGEYVYYTREKVQKIRSAQSIVSSAVHPDTGEYIPRLFRM
mmetsp:Transcript_14656/g.16917  ORF Transcript_14656/g.16917 Transcript_14656/m.16917 type:complete len:107 (+) Transcript_14656:53-373(+)